VAAREHVGSTSRDWIPGASARAVSRAHSASAGTGSLVHRLGVRLTSRTCGAPSTKESFDDETLLPEDAARYGALVDKTLVIRKTDMTKRASSAT